MQIKFVQSNAHTQLIQEAGVPRSLGYAEGHHYIKTGNHTLQLLQENYLQENYVAWRGKTYPARAAKTATSRTAVEGQGRSASQSGRCYRLTEYVS